MFIFVQCHFASLDEFSHIFHVFSLFARFSRLIFVNFFFKFYFYHSSILNYQHAFEITEGSCFVGIFVENNVNEISLLWWVSLLFFFILLCDLSVIKKHSFHLKMSQRKVCFSVGLHFLFSSSYLRPWRWLSKIEWIMVVLAETKERAKRVFVWIFCWLSYRMVDFKR